MSVLKTRNNFFKNPLLVYGIILCVYSLYLYRYSINGPCEQEHIVKFIKWQYIYAQIFQEYFSRHKKSQYPTSSHDL